MSLTLVATPGDPTANTYATRAEADTYHETRLYTTAWDDADPEDKDKALAQATALIDQQYSLGVVVPGEPYGYWGQKVRLLWTGSPAASTQRLNFPRTGIYDRNGVELSSTTIPTDLKNATAEFARQLLTTDFSAQNSTATKGIASLKASSVEITYKDYIPTTVIPDATRNWLVPSWYITPVSVPALFANV